MSRGLGDVYKRQELGLEREASALASDHLVLVTDLRLKAGT